MNGKLRRRPRTYYRVGTKRTVRTCLMCGKNFISEGPHNRRCSRCNCRLDHARDSTYYQPAVYSMENGKTTDLFGVS